MIDNSNDRKTIQFQFPLTIFVQLNQRLEKHSLYQYAIDLLSKNKMQEEFQLVNSTNKVNILNFGCCLWIRLKKEKVATSILPTIAE